jgi:hypothetical protein
MDEGPQIKMVSMVNKMENLQSVQVSGKAMVGVGIANKHRVLAPDLFHAKSTQPNLATFYSLQGGAGGSDWSTGLLCSCEEKNGVGGCGLCCKALCCSCCVYAEIAEFQGTNEGLLGSSVNGQHVSLDSVPISFLPLLVSLASLAFSTPFSAKPLGGVMACQMIFSVIFAAIVAATAGPCTRRGLSWLRGVLNLFPRAL